MKLFILLAFSLIILFFTTTVFARTTPEDIVNAQKSAYKQRLQTYSPVNQQKLEGLSQKIANLNKKITGELEENIVRQGQILDEYVRRNNIQEQSGDGINRNLSNPVENARYWLTYAHEAVSFQAAKLYIFNLTSEANIKKDANSIISQLESDINILNGKVTKSQKIIKSLVTK